MKRQREIETLKSGGSVTFKAFGTSMLPIIKSGSTLTFRAYPEYYIGEIVFCKVRGRIIEAHKITKKDIMGDSYRYMISNNRGHDNGWTKQIYGKVIGVKAP